MKPIPHARTIAPSRPLPLPGMQAGQARWRVFFRSPVAALVVTSAAWVAMALLVRPVGEFPLNDDWSYARAVFNLVEHGRLQLTGFTSMPLIAQALWGALFCLPLGFSFTALRLSTFVLGWLGLLAVYAILAELGAQRNLALAAALAMAANPLYFQLSLTFMTDVPFFTVSMLAILFFLRALRTGARSDMLLGYALSAVAAFIRQPAVVIPFAFLVAYLLQQRFSLRALALTVIPNLAFAGLLWKYPSLLRRTVGLPALFNRSYEPILESATKGLYQAPLILADRLLVALLYCGLFAMPYVIALAAAAHDSSSPVRRRAGWIATFLLVALLSGFTLAQNRLMPLTGNLLFNFGLGPALLRDTYLLNLPHWPTASRQFWLALTVLAILGGAILLRGLLWAAGRTFWSEVSDRKNTHPPAVFLLSLVFAYLLLSGVTGFLDRYLLWVLPLWMWILLLQSAPPGKPSRLAWGLATLLLALYAGFAVAGTHDYLAWNRARWQSAQDLVQAGVPPNRIDGGFEFNGWYAYDPGYSIQAGKSWWWVQDDEYLLAFGPVDGYTTARQYPFTRWLPPGQGEIVVLHRVENSASRSEGVK